MLTISDSNLQFCISKLKKHSIQNQKSFELNSLLSFQHFLDFILHSRTDVINPLFFKKKKKLFIFYSHFLLTFQSLARCSLDLDCWQSTVQSLLLRNPWWSSYYENDIHNLIKHEYYCKAKYITKKQAQAFWDFVYL